MVVLHWNPIKGDGELKDAYGNVFKINYTQLKMKNHNLVVGQKVDVVVSDGKIINVEVVK